MTKADEMAFPLIDITSGTTATGLTKREYFAAMALQGMASMPSNGAAMDKVIIADCTNAVAYADALIDELNKAYE